MQHRLAIMSTNFAKTLVWKYEYDVELWRYKQLINTMTTLCHWMKKKHEICLRTPLGAAY